MTNTIYQRTRNRKHQPNGIVVATKYRGGIRFGWSRCNFKAGDKFNVKTGLDLALKRANNGNNDPVPDSMKDDYMDMINRSVRYFFKNQSVKVVPVKVKK